jgi:hypothetical protein
MHRLHQNLTELYFEANIWSRIEASSAILLINQFSRLCTFKSGYDVEDNDG